MSAVSKTKDTWRSLLVDYISRVKFNPKSIQRVVPWMAANALNSTRTRTSRTRGGTTTASARRTSITCRTSGTTTTSSRSPATFFRLEALLWWGFCFFESLVSPAADHAADFHEGFREKYVFIVVEGSCFPRDAKHEFQKVEVGDELIEILEFMMFRLITGDKGKFDAFKKEGIYFRTDCVFGFLREVFNTITPYFICRY